MKATKKFQPKVSFLYFPPNRSHIKTSAGHAAVAVQFPNKDGDYETKNGGILRIFDSDFHGGKGELKNGTHLSSLITTYDGRPEVYPLPFPQNSIMVDDEKITDNKKYALLSNNCAHAAAWFLKQRLGYPLISEKIIKTPNDLKQQVIQNYSLSAKLAQIFDYQPQTEDKEHWDSLKKDIKILFRLEDKQNLTDNYQNNYNWLEIRKHILKKIQPYKIISDDRFLLLEVLKIVELFCGADQKEIKSEQVIEITEKKTTPELSIANCYSTLSEISKRLNDNILQRCKKYQSKNRKFGKTKNKLIKTQKLMVAMAALTQCIDYEATEKLGSSLQYVEKLKNQYKSIATAGLFGGSVTIHDSEFIKDLDRDISKMREEAYTILNLSLSSK